MEYMAHKEGPEPLRGLRGDVRCKKDWEMLAEAEDYREVTAGCGVGKVSKSSPPLVVYGLEQAVEAGRLRIQKFKGWLSS
ncbi:unnamed protein product [Allacma fusca]|uniref:Uncharacterized protein n=1 Tax=Allacma fusca TaxID=39272 RepID=A0A8J2JYG3_9HEXA|nr:unnamed protein product [Allacma fusca]